MTPDDSDLTCPFDTDRSPSSTDRANHFPQRIGRYRAERVLGTGGFGLVYLAHDDQLHRSVAIKIARADLLAHPEDVELYVTEARTVASLDHPTIVPVYDVGSTEEFPFFVVSKYVEGSDLAAVLRSSRLSHLRAAELVASVAEALHHAHVRGLVHRDVKPGNILIDKSGNPFVVDFGLALRERDANKLSSYVGTPSYMSPEQARGEGHRVDGRSDIFSLGIVLYELLAGRRPFRAESKEELFEQIASHDPRPLRQCDDTIPKELERICAKMLAKRASERYSVAKDVAEDLRHFLNQLPARSTAAEAVPATTSDLPPIPKLAGDTPPLTPSDSQPVRIVPKGLRSFDEHDAEFFLEILPGPRDRGGLPDSIRFWKSRIEQRDGDNTFSVGLIYGPSGCGKSSLIKAGLLPRLAPSVISIYIEATPDATESRLLAGLRKHCPELSPQAGLKDAIVQLRRGRALPRGKKVLLVVDQFEQWLHARQGDIDSELVQALRQCDGEHVQCIVMVRDDFWMAATGFMRALEIRLVEGHNSAAVDLFLVRHAEKVLTGFGRAFGVLPDSTGEASYEQKEFIKQAVAGLAQDGKVVCVRLALFAEMMKGRSWTPATLKEVGGTQGIGVTFLEETYSSTTAPPHHRFHQQAARAVLKALLPDSGTDIKGQMRSFDELLEASGYASRPRDFDALITMLDSEQRLVTPTDPDDSSPGGDAQANVGGRRYFQLTHDYLVPSLRDWLTRKQQETRRGRAELRLLERTGLWTAKPENRYLPSLWEHLNIRLLTRPKSWSEASRKMMAKANRVRLFRFALALVTVLALVGLMGWFGASVGTDDFITLLTSVDTAGVPDILAASDSSDYPFRWKLEDQYQLAEANSKQKLHLALVLVESDPTKVDYLVDRLLHGTAEEVPAIIPCLSKYQDRVHDRLCQAIRSGTSEQRIRAAAALAQYNPRDEIWPSTSMDVVTALVSVPTVESKQWIDLLRPVGTQLVEPLSTRYQDRDPNRDAERPLAAAAIASYLKDDPTKLMDLILVADTYREFLPLLQAIGPHRTAVTAALHQLLQASPDGSAKPEVNNTLWKKQANAAVCLLELKHADAVWPLLKPTPNPSLRSFIIDRLARLGSDFEILTAHLPQETDPGGLQGVILAIGEFDAGKMSNAQRQTAVEQLLVLYRTHPDPGVHSAVAWTLRRWREENQLTQLDSELRSSSTALEQDWFVNAVGQTFASVAAPVEFLMGATLQKKVSIDHRFAIAAREVTVAEFQRFRPEYRHDANYAPHPDCPANLVNWYDAVAYCNWLNREEGIPQEQWCYLPNERGEYAEGLKIPADSLRRTGYRLPMDAEWECACRAGTTSNYAFGDPEELLDRYGWCVSNSKSRMWPVGLLKPNGLGIFDMHANAWEWCHDPHQPKTDEAAEVTLKNQESRVLRGGTFTIRPEFVRSAARFNGRPDYSFNNIGFRPARTLP